MSRVYPANDGEGADLGLERIVTGFKSSKVQLDATSPNKVENSPELSTPDSASSPTALLGWTKIASTRNDSRGVLDAISQKLFRRGNSRKKIGESAEIANLEKGQLRKSKLSIHQSVHDVIAASGSTKLPPGFGSYAMLNEKRAKGEKQPLSVSLRRKQIFAQLSIIFGVSLLGIVINDYIAILVRESPSITSRWLLSLLILQVASFYLALLGYVYANEAGDVQGYHGSFLAGGINTVAFIMRIILELGFHQLIPESLDSI